MVLNKYNLASSNKLFASFSLVILFVFCLLIFSQNVFAAKKNKTTKSKTTSTATTATETVAPQSVPQQNQATFSTVHPVTQAALSAGVLECISRINQTMNFLTSNSQNGAYLFVPKSQPDQSLFSISAEIQTQNTTPIYATASFVSLTSGKVGSVYDSVEYVEKTCDYMENNVFRGLKRVGVLKKDVRMLDGGTVKIFLMPAGTGCVVIKKEVVQ